MFSTLTQKLLLGIYIFVLLSIPIGSYLASQSQTGKGRASEKKQQPVVSLTPKPLASPKTSIRLLDLASKSASLPLSSPTPSPSSATIATSYGPTLSLALILEGRPKNNQAAKVFVGIAEGTIGTNPKFLLSFTIDLPADGKYSGLSLAGLNSGSTYTALIKGPAQIATAIPFTMSPTVTNLNEGEAESLVSGDLNDDNVINSADYSIAQKILGATERSSKWNENADLNKDGIINTFDLGIISKNIGKTGASGAWTSPIPKTATPSAGLAEPSMGGPLNTSGHWIWVPQF